MKKKKSLSWGEKKKKDTNELISKTETDSQTQKTDLWLSKGKGAGGGIDQVGVNSYTLLDVKQIINKDLLYSSGNYTLLGREPEKEWIYVCCSVLSHSVVSDSVTPQTTAHRFFCPWVSPGKKTGVGCHALLQGILSTQGWNPGFPHCRQIPYCLSHKGSQIYVYL